MKAILISIKPQWVAKILNGEKTIEIRKTMPKCNLPIDVYIYCTKDNRKLLYSKILDNYALEVKHDDVQNSLTDYELNGKVVAKFTLRKVEEIAYECGDNGISKDGYKWFYTDSKVNPADLENASCLDEHDLFAYLQPKEAGGSICGYAYHIEDLVIFDKPKELSEFKHYQDERIKVMGNPYPMSFFGSVAYHCEKKSVLKPLTKAPQNFVFVESEE